jgi:hypothetical protein
MELFEEDAVMKILLRILLIAALFIGIKFNQDSIDKQRLEGVDKKPKLLFMPKEGVMRVLSFGHGSTASDLLFIQTLNYVMKELDKTPNPRYLNRLFQTLLALDPQAESRYSVGALFLSAVAQRHQSSLDLLAKADNRYFKIGADAAVYKDFPPKKERRVNWLDFKKRLIYPESNRGNLHPKHPRSWLINRARAILLVTVKREFKLAGEEFYEGAKNGLATGGLGPKEADDWRRYGALLIAASASTTSTGKHKLIRSQLEDSLRMSKRPRIRARIQARIKEVNASIDEVKLAKMCSDIHKQLKIRINSLAQLKQVVANNPSSKAILDELKKPYSPDSPEDYVFFADGRVRSPSRVVSETLRLIEERIRAYEERNERRRPESFKELEIDPKKDLPQEVRASYDSATGKFKATFQKP